MRTETTQLSAQYINSNFLKKIEDGRVKEAQTEGSAFIRTRLRQTAFSREIITPLVLADDEIDRSASTDLPMKIVEKEPESTATFVPFKGTAPRTWFFGPRYSIYFGKVESQRFNKSKFELMTYQNDIRKILSDNSVKDMADQEDGNFYETCVASVLGHPTQDLSLAGPLSADNVTSALKAHIARKRPIGKILMTKSLYYDALKLAATSVGNDVASRHYDQGIEEEEKLWGIPVVTTIKNDIVQDDEFWIFSPENYLGNFFLLQDATMFIKQEAEMIEFWSYESIGIGIGNTESITRVTLT